MLVRAAVLQRRDVTRMGSFSTGIGIISGFDTASLIEQILLGESRGRLRLQGNIATLDTLLKTACNCWKLLLILLSLGQSNGFEKKSHLF